MDEVNPPDDSRSDKTLLVALTETIREREEGMLSPAGKETDDERRRRRKESRKEVLGVLKELSVIHLNRLSAWSETLKGCEAVLEKSPPGGDVHPDTPECKDDSDSCSIRDVFWSVGDDIEGIIEKLHSITAKLDAAILQSPAEEELTRPETSVHPEDVNTDPTSDSGPGVEDDQNQTRTNEAKGQSNDFLEKSIDCQTDLQEQPEKEPERITASNEDETKTEWITVGLAGHLQDNNAAVPDVCFIRAPAAATGLLRCELADTLSCLMVTGSEELVSRVIRVKVQEGIKFHFPLTVVVPFHARYRGNYRDVAVKIVDEERRASYVTPLTTEGVYGGQRGSFAEVKVYSLGLFAVVSCLKRENYTAPKRGLSLKLSMDPRICLNYLPGSFTAPVMAQIVIQPVEAILLTSVKSKRDAFRSVVSTSPLLYLTHPTSQPLRRPLAITLPCPPNPEKQKRTRRQIENQGHPAWNVDASPTQDRPVQDRVRILGPHGKSKDTTEEFLVVLASKEKQWSVLDKVPVRNQQNGLVSFDLTENVDRLLVVRLLALLQPSVLSSLAEELEEAACSHSVTVVARRKRTEPHAVLVAALPTRDLDWELSKLASRGYGDVVEEGSRSEISMCEADQLMLRFSGNIASKGRSGQSGQPEFLTFHSQRNNHLLLHLTELDSFGNHSSPHYKGAVLFFKVTRGQLEWRGDGVGLKDTKRPRDAVCKLSLTLPKKVRSINRPVPARGKLCEETDSLSDSLLNWLSGELSEEDLSLLVPSLRLRRSTAQMAKLRAVDASFPSQAFHTLAAWRRTLPAVPRHPKASQLARCLDRSGRPDLARELLARQGTPK